MRKSAGVFLVVLALGASVLVPGTNAQAPPVEGAEDASQEAGGADGTDVVDPGGPHVVKVGALINDVQQLDLQTKSYAFDLYMWFKWDDPSIDPSRTFEFMNPYQLWGHIRSYAGTKPETLPDGTQYSSLHVQGQFNSDLGIDDYPFDEQDLIVAIEDKNKDESLQVYVPDTDPIAISEDITIPGWDIGEPFVETVSNTYPTNFGYPGATSDTYSRAVFGLQVTRPAGTYSLKLLLPMLLVALTAALALSVHPKYVEGRIGIGITALLTMVALQLTSDAGLPDVNNLILLDKLYLLSYVFVVLTLAVVVRNSWVDATGDIDAAYKADRRGLVFLSVGYFGLAAAILLFNLA
jgi:hypothetical protein